MTNEQIKNYFGEIYNGWFRRWRDCLFENPGEWDACVKEYDSIRKKHISGDKDRALVDDIANALLAEIDRRWRDKN